MLWRVGEGYNLCFDTRALARTYALDLSVVKGRICQSVAEDFVRCLVGEASPASQLFELSRFTHERETVEIVLSVLYFHLVEVYASCIDADRCTGLHAVGCNAMTGDGFGQMVGGRFGTSSASQHFLAYMHQSI